MRHFPRAEEEGDALGDLPVNDDLELVLQASELTAAPAAPSTAAGAGAAVDAAAAQLRPPRPDGGLRYAMEHSVVNLDAAYGALQGKMAMSFPFELDPFQKEGVVLMEAGESIFVAAHTSAGAPRLSLLRVASALACPQPQATHAP
jgi:hypothetical protein